jgi:hypothetical protein
MAGFVWVVPPTVIKASLGSWDQKIIAGLAALADLFTAKLEAYAKANAPWMDQTGNARQGLRAFAEKAARMVAIHLVHSVFYGIFLELGTRKMGPRPIILPTLEAHYGEVFAAMQALVGG